MHSTLIIGILSLLFLVPVVYSQRNRIPTRCCANDNEKECVPRCTRKSYLDLTDQEWSNLAIAFREIAKSGLLSKFANEHSEFFKEVHVTKSHLFFEYHDLLLTEVEMAFKEVMERLRIPHKVCLPYFDFSSEKQNLINSPIFRSDMLGSTLQQDCPGCLQTGRFKDIFSGIESTLAAKCIQRCAFKNPAQLTAAFNTVAPSENHMLVLDPPETNDFMERTRSVMKAHLLIHILFGGTSGTMFKSVSPLDPAFFFLHSRVEWYHSKSLDSPQFNATMAPFMATTIPVYQMTIGEAHALETCYNYAPRQNVPNQGPSAPPPSPGTDVSSPRPVPGTVSSGPGAPSDIDSSASRRPGVSPPSAGPASNPAARDVSGAASNAAVSGASGAASNAASGASGAASNAASGATDEALPDPLALVAPDARTTSNDSSANAVDTREASPETSLMSRLKSNALSLSMSSVYLVFIALNLFL